MTSWNALGQSKCQHRFEPGHSRVLIGRAGSLGQDTGLGDVRAPGALWGTSCTSDRVVYNSTMKTLTVRLPEGLVAEIEAECRQRQRPKSDLGRERLTLPARRRSRRWA